MCFEMAMLLKYCTSAIILRPQLYFILKQLVQIHCRVNHINLVPPFLHALFNQTLVLQWMNFGLFALF